MQLLSFWALRTSLGMLDKTSYSRSLEDAARGILNVRLAKHSGIDFHCALTRNGLTVKSSTYQYLTVINFSNAAFFILNRASIKLGVPTVLSTGNWPPMLQLVCTTGSWKEGRSGQFPSPWCSLPCHSEFKPQKGFMVCFGHEALISEY